MVGDGVREATTRLNRDLRQGLDRPSAVGDGRQTYWPWKDAKSLSTMYTLDANLKELEEWGAHFATKLKLHVLEVFVDRMVTSGTVQHAMNAQRPRPPRSDMEHEHLQVFSPTSPRLSNIEGGKRELADGRTCHDVDAP